MATLAEIAGTLDSAARQAALDATAELAVSTLRVQFGTTIENEVNDNGAFAAACAFINRHLGSARLGPELIARQLGCSRAHLYRVFARHAETVADYIREARLRRARDLLMADALRDQRIGDIALRCGFADPVHFARLFRQRFGLTPSDARAGATPNHETNPLPR
jgi:AraC-like DNA-binding protein